MLLSIIVPCYNEEKTILQCIENINQISLEDINLNLPAKIETSYDADGNLVETELVPARRIDIPVGNIEEVKARETTRFNNNMTTLNLEIRNQITEIETEEANLLNANDEIIQARQERKVFLDGLQTIFDNRSEEIKQTEPKGQEKAKKQLIANTKQQRKIFLADNDRVIRQLQAYTQFARLRIADFKRQLDELQKLITDGRKILILSDRKEHLKYLMDQIEIKIINYLLEHFPL